MSANNLTPEQAAWGAFYVKLHDLAERIRKEQAAPGDENANSQRKPAKRRSGEERTAKHGQ